MFFLLSCGHQLLTKLELLAGPAPCRPPAGPLCYPSLCPPPPNTHGSPSFINLLSRRPSVWNPCVRCCARSVACLPFPPPPSSPGSLPDRRRPIDCRVVIPHPTPPLHNSLPVSQLQLVVRHSNLTLQCKRCELPVACPVHQCASSHWLCVATVSQRGASRRCAMGQASPSRRSNNQLQHCDQTVSLRLAISQEWLQRCVPTRPPAPTQHPAVLAPPSIPFASNHGSKEARLLCRQPGGRLERVAADLV